MQNAPKIVIDRLRVALPADHHPDADVLTAFSERSLPERERATVLEHLAVCGDCREIMALALPEVELGAKAAGVAAGDRARRPAPNGWLAWPVLRWGFVAAGVAAIASFGLVQYQRSSRPTLSAETSAKSEPEAPVESPVKEAKNQPPPIPAASAPTKGDQISAPTATLAVNAEHKSKPVSSALGGIVAKEFDHSQALAKLQAPSRPGGLGYGNGSSLGGPLPHGPKVQFQNNFQASNAQNSGVQISNERGAAVPSLPARQQPPNAFLDAEASTAAASQTVTVQSQATVVQAQAQNQEALALPTQAMPLQPTEGGEGHMVERAKDPGTVVFGQAKVPVGSMPSAPADGSLSIAPPNASWTITAGGLQRSVDQGKSWQSVDVNKRPTAGGAAGAFMAQSASAAAPAGTASPTADTKKAFAKQIMGPTVFRAVAANGAEVWAGGSNGALYHSMDSGGHWTRVLPSSAGVALTGDVVTLDFPDSQHGRITTSTDEVWLTPDAGQTWQKR